MRNVCWWFSCLEAASVSARLGEPIVYPTDTVYGIGSSPWSEYGVWLVFRVKGRSPDKPVPLLLDGVERAAEIGEMDSRAWRLARRFWPGALTIVVPLRDTSIPRLVTGGTDCIGLRVPAHPAPRHLARASGGAIVGTSANKSGRPPKRTLDEVVVELGSEPVAYFLDGGVLPGTPSTVVNLCGEGVVFERVGAIPRGLVEAVIAED